MSMDEIKTSEHGCQSKKTKNALMALTIVVLGIIVVVSILREKIVNPTQNQVSVTGQGKISYQPDIANVTLGVQIDRVAQSEQAINQLNEKMTSITAALEKIGIAKENIETQNYSLNTQYDYAGGSQKVAGYDANQKLVVKIVDIKNNPGKVSEVISAASQNGSNQMLGVSFDVSNMNDLKQQARILAIADARKKSASLASAAGISLGKVVGWYENVLQSPENPAMASLGLGGPAMADKAQQSPTPQITTGTQDIIIEVSLNYEVK